MLNKLGDFAETALHIMFRSQMDAATEKLHRVESNIIWAVTAGFLMASGVVFLAISLSTYFTEMLNVPKAAGFLIVGALLIVTGGAIKLYRRGG